jgi:hypothetical protein
VRAALRLKAILAGAAVAAGLVVTAPPAQAWCGDGPGPQTYPCIPRPPKISVPSWQPRWPDPRPPLTEKNSVWCQLTFLDNGNGSAYTRVSREQIRKRAWPDYYKIQWVYVYWTGRMWIQPQNIANRQYVNVNCDV